MKHFFIISKLMLACILIVAANGIAFAQKLPVVDGKETVAIVNDEPITLEEFNRTVAASNTAMSEKEKADKISYSATMRRLINIRLILLEAKNMGLDELPEITNLVDNYSRDTLMRLLMTRYLKDLKADKEEVERLYKEAIKEWKLKTVFFEKEDDAKKFDEKIKAGKDFDELMKKAVEKGNSKGSTEGDYLKKKDLKIPVYQIVSRMEVGSVSPISKVGKKGFIIFKLEDIRYPEDENSKAREMAEREALNRKRVRTAKEYYNDLKQRYVKIDEKLLDSLDFESKEPGFNNLLKDERIVAEITGEKPVTVGKLTTAIKKNFYHGMKSAIKSKRVNTIKRQVLEEMLQKHVLLKEAIAQGIDQTESYKNQVNEYKNSVTFDMFIKKVVAPEIKLSLKEVKTYYNKNSKKYTSPEMMRIKNLVFAKRGDAVDALDKLMKGTDFDWLSSNAEGQIDKTAEGLLKFEGRMLIIDTMPEDVQKVISNAKPGDFRLYASPKNQFYVLYVYHVVDPKLKPFDDVKKEISEKVFKDKLEKTIEVWADKLREYYPVKIYRKDLR